MSEPLDLYLDILKETSNMRKEANLIEEKALLFAEQAKLPENLRPAEAKDIVVNAVIWYPEWIEHDDEGRGWNIVEEVLRPSDPYKAYCAHEGCRYGLDGAFVEI